MESWIGIVIFFVIFFIFIAIFVYLWYVGASATAWAVALGLFFLIIIIMMLVWAFYPEEKRPMPPVNNTTIYHTESATPMAMSEPEPPGLTLIINNMPPGNTDVYEMSNEYTPPPVYAARPQPTPMVYQVPLSRPRIPTSSSGTPVLSTSSPQQRGRVVNRNGVPTNVQVSQRKLGQDTYDADPRTKTEVVPGRAYRTNVYEADTGQYTRGVVREAPSQRTMVVDPLERPVNIVRR